MSSHVPPVIRGEPDLSLGLGRPSRGTTFTLPDGAWRWLQDASRMFRIFLKSRAIATHWNHRLKILAHPAKPGEVLRTFGSIWWKCWSLKNGKIRLDRGVGGLQFARKFV